MELFDSDKRFLQVKKGDVYYFIQFSFAVDMYRVMTGNWRGTNIDCLRIVRTNFFTNKQNADNVCFLLNQRYQAIRGEALRMFGKQ